ncbi:hypothetical protein MBM_03588 [Drepanopeziza brunnea f. sp. 'multigermtubi' MB_m1]|uniref:Uncharacterized protein n=1 Tax=Marssonina brunnea f. sp. multigermtubi (strain MB_m1) TaxID=1072389 RepID=K1WLK9_MARBU|nr:uncharacterized protein MBM_03588 [Drepanopeziza brunnea f. sp. 'multigermtubi' MB_m1]EKD18595.1 hypothetical protein MBM_03588 [Drepanopeziza brunnea f. sp. 'multigermtubi' MB_m1]
MRPAAPHPHVPYPHRINGCALRFPDCQRKNPPSSSGVPVGGKNTGAVTLNASRAGGWPELDGAIMAFYKCPAASQDSTDGIEPAVRRVLGQAGDGWEGFGWE